MNYSKKERQQHDAFAMSITEATSYNNLQIPQRIGGHLAKMYGKAQINFDTVLPELVATLIALNNDYESKRIRLGFVVGDTQEARYYQPIKDISKQLYDFFNSIISAFNSDQLSFNDYGSFLLKYKKILLSNLIDDESINRVEISKYVDHIKLD